MRFHGGKHFLADAILKIAAGAPHKHYVEPFFGGGWVLFKKDPEGVSEVVNDINRELTNFWRVLQVPALFDTFIRIVQATPCSQAEYQWACRQPDRIDVNPALAAHAFFIRYRQSFGGQGKTFTAISRTRTRSGMNEQVSQWLGAVDKLPEAHKRLKRVLILNKPAIEVIRSEDTPQTLFYLDPPYLPETRTSPEVYEHEMTTHHHEELLHNLGSSDFKGKFMLSGYRSHLYDDWARQHGFKRHDFELANHSAGGKEKRRMIESVWTNF